MSRLYLVGGGALVLLGSPRLMVDIDFVGDDISPSELHKTILQIAKEYVFVNPKTDHFNLEKPTTWINSTLKITSKSLPNS